MHERAMLLSRKEHASDICEYSPIAKALSKMDACAEETIKKKFDVAYMLAKEGMAFHKMKPICQLLEREGVDLGGGYKNDLACSTFIDYIAREMRNALSQTLKRKGSLVFKWMEVRMLLT